MKNIDAWENPIVASAKRGTMRVRVRVCVCAWVYMWVLFIIPSVVGASRHHSGCTYTGMFFFVFGSCVQQCLESTALLYICMFVCMYLCMHLSIYLSICFAFTHVRITFCSLVVGAAILIIPLAATFAHGDIYIYIAILCTCLFVCLVVSCLVHFARRN